MGRPVYTWEVAERRKNADGSTTKFVARRQGTKPPKNAKNVRRNGGPVISTAAQKAALMEELARLDELDKAEAKAAEEQRKAEEQHKRDMAELNQLRAEKLQREAEGKNPPKIPTEPEPETEPEPPENKNENK